MHVINGRSFFMSRHRWGERVPMSSAPVCVLHIHSRWERSVADLRCIRISGHPVRTLTGRCIRRPLTGLRVGNNNFECSSRGEIDTDTKRTYGGLDEDRGDESKRERARERKNGREKSEREGSRYTLQVRARVSRAANEPAAARFWLHSGLRYINMRLTDVF